MLNMTLLGWLGRKASKQTNKQLWPLDECLPILCVLWPMAIVFGCHGNIKFKKKKKIFLNDISSKSTEAVWL